MRIVVALAVACSSPPAAHPITNAQATSAERSEPEALVAEVFERMFADQQTMPDAGLLPKTGPIYVLDTIGLEPPLVPLPALPPGTRRPLIARKLADLEAEAERTKKDVAYVRFNSLEIDRDHATASYGVDIAIPANPNAIKMCCCSGTYRFVKQGGRWQIDKTAGVMMSCA